MELRDQFAASALTGLIMAGELGGEGNESREDLAKEAYAIADAMLKVREDRPKRKPDAS